MGKQKKKADANDPDALKVRGSESVTCLVVIGKRKLC